MTLYSFICNISQNVVNEINEDCYLLFYDYYVTPINIFPLQSLIIFPWPNADKVQLVLVSKSLRANRSRRQGQAQAGQGGCHVRSGGAGPGQPTAALVTDPADQKYCCSFFWIVLQGREEKFSIPSTCCVWCWSVMALCVWWMGWEDEGLVTTEVVWVSQSRPQATVESRQRFDGQLFTLGYFLWSKWILTSKKCITSSWVQRRPHRALSPILYQELENQRWIIVLLWLWLEEQKFF